MNSLLKYMRAASSSLFYPAALMYFRLMHTSLGGQRSAGFVLPLEMREEKSPSPFSLKLKCVSEICLGLIGRGGKKFYRLYLLLFYFEATSLLPGFSCLSDMGTSRENMTKQVFKAIKGQAGAQAGLSIIARSI